MRPSWSVPSCTHPCWQRNGPQLGFQSELGHPWFGLFGRTVYLALALFWWLADDAMRALFVEGAYIAASRRYRL